MVNFEEALLYSWKIAIANILSDLIFSSTFKDHLKKKFTSRYLLILNLELERKSRLKTACKRACYIRLSIGALKEGKSNE